MNQLEHKQIFIHACAWSQVIAKLLAWCGPCSETLFASATSMQDCIGVSHCAPPPTLHEFRSRV
jgi:hypothetical protein